MDLKNRGRVLAAGLFAGALLGGGLAMVTPAGAVVQDAAAAINWKTIWKTEIKPRAKKTFYTKKASNARYYTKVQTDALYETKAAHDASMAAALGNYYTKAQTDAALGNYYTKAQSDAKYAPAQPLYRGSYELLENASGAGDFAANGISFGATFSAAPTAHYIKIGDPLPVGCLGTASAPNASPGHLCVFEGLILGPVGANRGVCRGATGICGNNADAFGAGIYSQSSGVGLMQVFGTWAARPLAVANPASPSFIVPNTAAGSGVLP